MSTPPTRTLPAPLDRDLDRVFAALANKTRRAILNRLGTGSATVSDLARPFDMSLPGVSKHLRVLEEAGLVERHIDGRVHHCSIHPAPLQDAERWLTDNRRFWEDQLTRLADHLEPDGRDEGLRPA